MSRSSDSHSRSPRNSVSRNVHYVDKRDVSTQTLITMKWLNYLFDDGDPAGVLEIITSKEIEAGFHPKWTGSKIAKAPSSSKMGSSSSDDCSIAIPIENVCGITPHAARGSVTPTHLSSPLGPGDDSDISHEQQMLA